MDGTVRQILDVKGHEVTMVESHVSLLECAKLMNTDGIGSLLVIEDELLVGILHERDICRVGVCQGLNLAEAPVSDIMNTEFPIVGLSTSILSAMALISKYRIRHLPVVDDKKIMGLISIGDLTKWVLDLQKEDIDQLIGYIGGDLVTGKIDTGKLRD